MAIKLKPGYLKAHHRRGKGYVGLNKYEMAIKDFRYILECEPDNKEVNKDLQEARKNLNEKLAKGDTAAETKSAAPKKADEKKKNKFVRVAIEEESDEEEEEATEEEPRIEEVGGALAPKEDKKVKNTIKSKFPLTTPKEIEEHSREAKK